MRRISLVICFILILIVFFIILGQPSASAENSVTDQCQEFLSRELKITIPPMQGDDVKELQEVLLRDLGIYPGQINGVFEKETSEAVKTFQRLNELPETGIVDDITWLKIGNAYESSLKKQKKQSPKPEGKVELIVDLNKRQLTVLSGGKVFKNYPVCIGNPKTSSPVGEWKVIEKSHRSNSALGTRWMRLNAPWGNYGIHGTSRPWSIGRAESHGCIRMYNRDVEELYEWVPIGTKVKIIGETKPITKRKLKRGMTGQDVVIVQKALREKSLFLGRADGRFGPESEFAVKYLQVHFGLTPTGVVDEQVYQLLGLQGRRNGV